MGAWRVKNFGLIGLIAKYRKILQKISAKCLISRCAFDMLSAEAPNRKRI
jgi:hypothetical protein